MPVRERKAACLVVITCRKIAPVLSGTGTAGVKRIGGVAVDRAHAVCLLIKNNKDFGRSRYEQISWFQRSAAIGRWGAAAIVSPPAGIIALNRGGFSAQC